MIGQPLSAAELNKVKNYLMGSALEGGTGSGIPYSPEYIEKLKAAAIAKPKPKAAKGLLSAKPLQSTGLLQSPDTEFTTDNINPYTDAFTRDAVGPTVQETTAAARRGVPALPSAVATVPNDPNIAVSQLAPKVSKEVTTTTKPDGTKSEKIKHVEEPIKTTPKPNTANGDFIPADAMPKTRPDIPSLGDINGARMGPAEAPLEPQMIPDTMDVSLPEKYRFAPTPPAAPISAQHPATMPAIPEKRFKDTTGLVPAENTASQGLDTTISALAPLPSEEEASFNSLKEQRQAQIDEARAAASNFDSSYKPRTDMSALLSFIGSQLGRDYLKGYKAPAGLGDLVGMQDRLEQNIAKAKDGLSQTDLDYLKARMGLQYKRKTKEEWVSTFNNSLDIAKLKAAAAAKGTTPQQDRSFYDSAFKEYVKEGDAPGEGSKIAAFLEASVMGEEVNKLLIRNNGVPDPLSVDGGILAGNIANQIIIANRYKSMLGALTGGDKKLLEQTVGMDTDQLKEWVVTNLSEDKREGLLRAMGRFQTSLSKAVSSLDEQARLRYGPEFESTYSPNVMRLHDRRMKSFKDSRANYLGSMSDALDVLGRKLSKEDYDELMSLASPEEKKLLEAEMRKAKTPKGGAK